MKNKKEKLVMVLLVIGLIVMTVAISYAAFRFTQVGSVLNQITTGSITMSYTESSNVISMTGALPTTDATGKVKLNEGEYFDFTVGSSVTGTANINFEIAAQELDGNTIDGSYIKYYLTSVDSTGNETELMAPKTYTEETTSNEYTGRPSNMMSLYTGSMSSSTTTKYRLRLYVDESYNPQGDGGSLIYKVRVNVYGMTGDEISKELAPGLYDKDNVLIKSWDELGIDIEEDTIPPESSTMKIDSNGTKLVIDSSVTRIGAYQFYGAELEEIIIPDSVTDFGSHAFGYCEKLASVKMLGGCYLYSDAVFAGCSSLKVISIGQPYGYFQLNVFHGCSNLSEINYAGTKESWNNITFQIYWNSGCPEITVHCIDGDIVIPTA